MLAKPLNTQLRASAKKPEQQRLRESRDRAETVPKSGNSAFGASYSSSDFSNLRRPCLAKRLHVAPATTSMKYPGQGEQAGMNGTRLIGLLGLFGVGFGAGLACESSEGPGGGAGFCAALEGYVSPCDAPTVCERALVRDCDSLEAILQPGVAESTAACMNALGQPQECIDEATDASLSSPAVQSFATALCLECGDGSDGCEDEVLEADADTDLGRAGRLARVLTRGALERLQDECTTGDDCAAGFESCAKQVLARDVPDETATCLVDAVFDDYDASCGSGGTTGGSETDSNPTFPTDPTQSTNPTDPTDGSDTDGDTDDTCDQEGCVCMFNEDCAGELMCPEGTCVSVAACTDDANEPNDGEMQATLLDPITDDDDQGSMVSGQLSAPGDTDWFRYEGDDTAFAVVSPYVQVNVNALQLCMYAECVNGLGNTDVSCNEGTTLQPSPNGRPGCCGINTGGFQINLSCGGTFTDDDALIFMSVTGSEAGVCQDYTVTYNY